MKTASRVMYIIARIFLVIEIVYFVVALVLGIVGVATSKTDLPSIGVAGVGGIVFSAIMILICLIVFAITSKALRDLRTGKKSGHVLCLILGILSLDIFFILGSIFGLVSD